MKIPKTQLSVLPEEIIEEILFRLDVKSLLRFRCVSKSYRSLIDSERFIKIHHQKSKRDTTLAHHSVLFFSDTYSDTPDSYSGEGKASRCSLVSFLDNSDNPNNKLNIFPTNLPPYNKISVVGCCNGLVCILLHTNTNMAQFILWNPSTRISKKLPEFNKIGCSDLKGYGFGWDESSDDYKVISVEESQSQSQSVANLYSLKRDSWKQIDGWDMNVLPIEFGVFANGKLHWANGDSTHEGGEIVAFDLKREVFELVCYYSELMPVLGTFGECLAMLCMYGGCYEKIWVVKKESWENVVLLYDNLERGVVWTCPSVRNAAKGDMILMNFKPNTSYLVYDMKNDCIRYTGRSTDTALTYVESLISPFRV